MPLQTPALSRPTRVRIQVGRNGSPLSRGEPLAYLVAALIEDRQRKSLNVGSASSPRRAAMALERPIDELRDLLRHQSDQEDNHCGTEKQRAHVREAMRREERVAI